MIDVRIYTFLEVCKLMNYHKVADSLCMSQPAVSQHIKYLEEYYDCKLFHYQNKRLSKTEQCIELEKRMRSIVSLSKTTKEVLSNDGHKVLSIGATKTIGEHVLPKKLLPILKDSNIHISLLIDNTQRLFEKLNTFQLDIVLVEGYFDKKQYLYQLIEKQNMIGICSKDHPFASKEVTLEQVFQEHLLVRELGSGTRAIFEQFLAQHNYSLEAFTQCSMISSCTLIEQLVAYNGGISFVYDIVGKNPNVATFTIKNNSITHEFNYVYLKDTSRNDIIELLEQK